MAKQKNALFSCTAEDLVDVAEQVFEECEKRDEEWTQSDSPVYQRGIRRNVSFDACLVAVSIIQLYAALGAEKAPD